MPVKRIISGIVLIAIAFAMIIPGGMIMAGFLMIVGLIAYRELVKCFELTGILEIVGYVGIVIYYLVMTFVSDRTYLLLVVTALVIAFMTVYVVTFPKFEAKDIMISTFCVIYAPIMFGFIYMTRELEFGFYTVWLIFICSSVCDMCAYFVGMLIGKHKMAPILSPKKSIEGAVGGVIGTIICSGLYGHFVLEPQVPGKNITVWVILISIVGAFASMIGDLAASAIKRNRNIKDYGKLIPGHGGIMDRFDSIIFTAPMIYLLTILFINR